MICELISLFKREMPNAEQVYLTPAQHRLLCRELLQPEGLPVRVYVYDGLRILIAGEQYAGASRGG